MKHTSGNQVNIQIKLCVHPNIVSKGTKSWIKRSLRVITWLGYKRKDISGTIEFKGPSIREHSIYSPSTDTFTIIPLLLSTNFGVKTWDTVILTTYFSFFFFHFMYTFFSFFFLFLCTKHCCSDHNLNFHQFTWQLIYIYLLSPTWTETYPIWMFPYSMAKGQVINEGLGFNQSKTSESDSASKMSWISKI